MGEVLLGRIASSCSVARRSGISRARRGQAQRLFRSPLSVEKGISELLHKHVLWADIADSLRRVAIGYGVAVLIGIPLGYASAGFPREPGGESLAADSAAHQSHCMDSCGHHILRHRRPGCNLPGLSRSVLSHRGRRWWEGVSTVPLIFRRAGRNFRFIEFPTAAQRLSSPPPLPQILHRLAHRARNRLGLSSSRAK